MFVHDDLSEQVAALLLETLIALSSIHHHFNAACFISHSQVKEKLLLLFFGFVCTQTRFRHNFASYDFVSKVTADLYIMDGFPLQADGESARSQNLHHKISQML